MALLFHFRYFAPVSFFLRLTGITNAAVWLGAALFYTAAVSPAFFSSEMLRILPPLHAGAAAQVLAHDFYVLQYWCAAIALAHLVVEWLYAGKPVPRWSAYLVIGLLALALFNGLLAQPRMKRLHLERYGRYSTPQQREKAGQWYGVWQTAVHLVNVCVILGVWVHLWEVSSSGTIARFVGAAKYQGLTNR